MSAAVEFGTQCQPTFSTELITSVADILGRVTLRSIIKQNLFVQQKKSSLFRTSFFCWWTKATSDNIWLTKDTKLFKEAEINFIIHGTIFVFLTLLEKL